MPQYIALKSFHSRHYGAVHRGTTVTLPADYGKQLERNGLVRVRALPAAPLNAAHEAAPDQKKVLNDTADHATDGKETPSSVSRRVRRSRAKTSSTSSTRNTGPG